MPAGLSFLEQLTDMDGIGTDIYRCMLWQLGKKQSRNHGEKSGRRPGNEASEELMKLKKLTFVGLKEVA